MPENPADLLRRAAAKLRRIFDNLGTEGLADWAPAPDGRSSSLHAVKTVDAPGGDVLVAAVMFKSTAAYIATMHPGVGLTLADWLEHFAATEYDPHADIVETDASHEHALQVARAVLGQETGR